MDDSLTKPRLFLSILLPFALGYYLSYLARVVNAVLAPDLTRELGLGADTLGLLTASYFITFAAAQLPLGILLDRYSPRRVESLLLLLAAIGALLFATGDSATDLILGRGLIGLGVSACLMAAFKTFTLWFSPQRLPLFNGVILAAGGVGAITATAPVQAALSITDWRGVFLMLAGAMLLASVILYLLVPDHRETGTQEHLADQIRGLKTIFQDRFFWMIAPLTMLSQAAFISIQSLWAGPWLQDTGGLEREATADTLFLIACAMVAGFLVMGGLAERLSRLGVRPILLSTAGMAVFQLIQLWIIIGINPDWLTPLWIGFGFFGTTGIVQYAVLSQHYPRRLAGRANTAINLLVFVAIFVLQYSIGAIINLWPEITPGHYQTTAYRSAFGTALALQAAALIWFLHEYRRQLKAG